MTNPLIKRVRSLGEESIYIGTSESDLKREIAENCWSILTNQEECRQTTVPNLVAALDEVIDCRRSQVIAQADEHGAIFYVWFDEQACQLTCCTISGRHPKLPFDCEIVYVPSAEPIVDDFLSSPFHDGIPADAIQPTEWTDDVACERTEPLKVYAVRLP